MKKTGILLLSSIMILATSCYTVNYSQSEICDTSNVDYANDIEDENPGSILIMPPINRTVNVELKQIFYTTLAMPLAEKGYYVISPFTSLDLLKSNSAYDSELFIQEDLSQFRKIFGTDAILFTIINEYSKSAIAGNVTVNVDYIIRSAKTNKTLFHHQGEISFDSSFYNEKQNLEELLVAAIFTTVNSSMVKKFNSIHECNKRVIDNLPDGPHLRKKQHKNGTESSTVSDLPS